VPSPSTNQGPVDDLGSAATTDGDTRSKIIKNWPEQPAANYRCLACPAPGGTSPPIPGCPAPSRKENPALRNFTSADAPEQPALHVPNQPDSHRPRRTERRLRALCPGKGQLQSVRSRRLPTAWCVCASMAYGVRRRVGYENCNGARTCLHGCQDQPASRRRPSQRVMGCWASRLTRPRRTPIPGG